MIDRGDRDGGLRVRQAAETYGQAFNRLTERAVNVRSEARDAYRIYRSTYDIATQYQREVLPLRKIISDEIQLRFGSMQDDVFALLKRFWYDNALSPGMQTWGCLENVAAPDQIVFGTDWPFANVNVTETAMKTYESLPAISSAERAAIDRGNALRLFPQFA